MKTMTEDTRRGAESLIGLFSDENNVLCEKIVHKDGTIEYLPIDIPEEIQSITERFKDTDTIPHDWAPDQETRVPHDWTPQDTDTLEQLSESLTREEHINRSLQLEVLLVKIFGTNNVDTKGNQAFKAVIQDLCKIAGGHWPDYIQKIK